MQSSDLLSKVPALPVFSERRASALNSPSNSGGFAGRSCDAAFKPWGSRHQMSRLATSFAFCSMNSLRGST